MLSKQASYTWILVWMLRWQLFLYTFCQTTKSSGGYAKSHRKFLVNRGTLGDGRSKICKLFYIFKSWVINCEMIDVTGLWHCLCILETGCQTKFITRSREVIQEFLKLVCWWSTKSCIARIEELTNYDLMCSGLGLETRHVREIPIILKQNEHTSF